MSLFKCLITITLTSLLLSACGTFEIGVEQAPTTSVTTVAPTMSATTAISTADWKTYTNDKYGFRFKYPATLNIRKGPASNYPDEVFYTTNMIELEGPLVLNDETSGLTMAVLTPEAVEPAFHCTDDRDCLAQYTSSRRSEPIHAKLTGTVLGRPVEGVEYYETNPLYAVVEWNFVFEDQGRPWVAYASINLKSGETDDPYNRLLVFEQILATLELFDGSAGK